MLLAALLAACGSGGPTQRANDPHYVPPLPDAGPDDAGDAEPRCPRSRNPEGEFANTLIRGAAPGDDPDGNTWEALVYADAFGWPYVEVDVRITADGRIVPGREDDLSGFTDCVGSLAESTAKDLASCNYLHSGVPVRPIDDGLVDSSFRAVYVDLKSTLDPPFSTPEQLVAAIAELRERVDDPGSIVAMSYDLDAAEALLAADIRTALKGYPSDPRPLLHDAESIGAEMICVELETQTPAFYAEAVESDVWLLPWSQRDDLTPAAMQALLDAGGGGLITSAPENVSALVRQICLP